MKISIIIPTHNRAETLRNAIESIIPLRNEADFEFVIVDNNSSDQTRQVVESYSAVAKYVFEGKTSFTMARKTGADNASGEILLYLDDDVLVKPGTLKNIVDVFTSYSDCGVIAGKIDAKFLENPPAWALDCQKSFNGWSLFNHETYPELIEGVQEVGSAAGPMMAIRKTVYDLVGGFPPDTVGVETNKGPKSFNKLYIGPGDYGLCLKVRSAGFKILFSDAASVFHVIPPTRFTVEFWRSRMIGEGYHQAISQRGFFHAGRIRAYLTRIRYAYHFSRLEKRFLSSLQNNFSEAMQDGMQPDELWLHYYKAYLDMDYVLRLYPNLWKFLWSIGVDGVSDKDYSQVIERLPNEYKYLVSSELVYDSTALNSFEIYQKLFINRGYYSMDKTIFFKNKMIAIFFIMILGIKSKLSS